MPRLFGWSLESGFAERSVGPALERALEALPELAGAPALALLPPLWDHHGHVYWYGALLEQADLRGASSPEEVLRRLRAAEKSLSKEAWLEGFGWDQNLWGGRFPGLAQLDALFPSRPVYLRRIDGHAAWANSEALSRAGVAHETPSPEGGAFLREKGRLTGILLDRAMEPVSAAIPAPGNETVERRLLLALEKIKGQGLAGVTDMGLEEAHVAALKRLDAEERLPIPVEGYVWIRNESTDPGEPYVGRRFRCEGAKLFADGALGSRGAALFGDYEDDPGNRGLLLWEAEPLAKKVKELLSRGFTPAIHAIGDRANAMVLDALEASGCPAEARVEHAQVLRNEDLLRMARQRVTASIQPCQFLSDSPWASDRLGPRMAGAYRAGSLARGGLRLLVGTDFPIEDPDPSRNFLACALRDPESERLGLIRLLLGYAPPPAFGAQHPATLAACESPEELSSASCPKFSRFRLWPLEEAP